MKELMFLRELKITTKRRNAFRMKQLKENVSNFLIPVILLLM